MDVIFTSSDLELKHFAKQNALFIKNQSTDKIRLVIEDQLIKFNKNLLTKNFHFFDGKIQKEKNNKNQCFNILYYLDQELFSNEDIEFLKNKFFHFVNFLFSNFNGKENKNSELNFRMKIKEIIKFIEICIVFEPKNSIIDKIHKIIYCNAKVKTAIEAYSNKPGGEFIKDKLDFLMQKLQSLKNFSKSNPINKLEKANLKGFGLNASYLSDFSAKSLSKKSSLSNCNLNLNNSINSANNASLKLKRSESKFSNLLNFAGNFNNVNPKKPNELFLPKYKNSIFFRYSFNLIRHLYDLPLALNLNNKEFTENPSNKHNKNLNITDNNGNNNYHNSNNRHNNPFLNKISGNDSNNNNSSKLKKVNSFSSITNEKLKTLSSYNQPILDKNAILHGQVNYNKHQNEGGGSFNKEYLFQNSSLEEETRNYFTRKNKGFYAFVDSLFNNKNFLFAYLFNNKSIDTNYQPQFLINKLYEKRNKIGLIPNKNYLRNVSSLPSISDEYSSHIILANKSNNDLNNLNNLNNNNNKNYEKDFTHKSNLLKNSFRKQEKSHIKKSLENILVKEFTESNKELSRFFLNKKLQNFDLRCEKAILIQKHFRRYLSYKNYLLKIKDYLKFRLVSSIEKIQAFYRSFILRKKIKFKLLLEEILRTRIYASKHIFFALRKFQSKKKFKQNYLILQIIQIRTFACTKIQTKFRSFTLRKFMKDFLYKENNFYKITYPFKANKVQLKLYIPRPIDDKRSSFEIFSDEKIFNFEFCNFRKIHVLYIDTNLIKPGKYRALMLVDGISTCDGRYPHVEFSDGFYYNIIDVKESKNEEKKKRAKKNPNEKNQYFMNKYGFNYKKDNNGILNSEKNNNINNKAFNNKFYSPPNHSNQATGNYNNLCNYNSMNNIAAIKLDNLCSLNSKINLPAEKNENGFFDQNPDYSQFPNFISGANINSNIYNYNNDNQNNYPYAFTDSNNNLNTGGSYREEQLETRNTWANQSHNSSNKDSQKSNNSNTESKKYFRSKSNISNNNLNNNNNDLNYFNNINNKHLSNNFNLNQIKNDEINLYPKNLRQESFNTFNSNVTNNEECYFNELIYNYNELRRNLLPNGYYTKTISYMEKLQDCIKNESENYVEDSSN